MTLMPAFLQKFIFKARILVTIQISEILVGKTSLCTQPGHKTGEIYLFYLKRFYTRGSL